MQYLRPMPLYREWTIDNQTMAAIWKVEEPEAFFTERTGLSPGIANDKRRIEHLAGRFLLRHLQADFPLLQIQPDDHDKPHLVNKEYHFSISHSWPYIAVILSSQNEVGIDIQVWHRRMQQLQHKFLSPAEQSLFHNDDRLITLAWCAKEAVYKWQGRRGVDFIEHLPIRSFSRQGPNIHMDITAHLTAVTQPVAIETLLEADFACAYTHLPLQRK